MSNDTPATADQDGRHNVVLLLREAYLRLNDIVITRLAEQGHDVVRPAHAAVFQFLDDTGTTVSVLAQRARMTKQAMAQLVQHLEEHGYVARSPDPADRRAKLVVPTDRGREVFTVARGLVPEIEGLVGDIIGTDRLETMRADLEAIRRRLATGEAT
jgi:DNA-binding MarR family transcriptional regulator